MTLLTTTQINNELRNLKDWAHNDKHLVKNFKFKDFNQAMEIINKIAAHAERLNHHPEWTNVYNKLTILLSTHDSGGVTQKDIELAQAIESVIPR